MAGVKLWGITVLKSDAEKDIRAVFEDSITRLNEQKTKLLDDITEWSDALMRSIYKHATGQRYLVEEEYTAQVQNLNRSLKDFLDELHVHERKNDDNRVNQLLEQCRALKFELSALETNGQTIPFIEAPNRGNLPIVNGDEKPSFDDASTSNGNGRSKQTSHRQTSFFDSNQLVNNTKQSSTSQSLIMNPAFTSDNGTDNNSSRESLPAKMTGLVEKCPICFMIYPKNMTASNRNEHVFEHDIDKYFIYYRMSNEHSFSQIIGIKQWETDIRHAFNLHVMTLFAAKWKMLDEITEWRNKLLQWIEEYDKQQRNLLEEYYAKKVTDLNAARDQVLEQALKYEEKKETEQVNQLVDQCNSLKVELAVLVEMVRPIPSFQIVTDQQQAQEPVKEIIDEQEQKTVNNPPPPSEQITPPPPPPDSTNEIPLINTDDKPSMFTIPDEIPIEKCPICFMIFPQMMTIHGRNAHINEHYTDY